MRGQGTETQSGTARKVHSNFFDAARPAGAGWGFAFEPFLLTFAFLQEWSCPGCTVKDDETEHKCTVCRAWRPASKPIGRTSGEAAQAKLTDSDAKRAAEDQEWAVHEATAKVKVGEKKKSWTCAQCTLSNGSQFTKCSACACLEACTSSKDKVRPSHVFCLRLEV